MTDTQEKLEEIEQIKRKLYKLAIRRFFEPEETDAAASNLISSAGPQFVRDLDAYYLGQYKQGEEQEKLFSDVIRVKKELYAVAYCRFLNPEKSDAKAAELTASIEEQFVKELNAYYQEQCELYKNIGTD